MNEVSDTRPRRQEDRTQISLAKIQLVGVIATALLTSVTAYFMAAMNRQQHVAAVKVEEVAVQLDATTADTNEQLETIHGLVNSAMGTQLELNMAVTRRLADTTREPADIAAAASARTRYEEHMANQAIVDAQP